MANIFALAASAENWFKMNLKENGYECKTTFYSDLTIAELMSGKKGIKDTIKNVMENWINNIEYITEFCMAVNWKSWEMYDRLEQTQDEAKKKYFTDLGKFYSDQYYKVYDKIYSHYKSDEKALNYFYRTTD